MNTGTRIPEIKLPLGFAVMAVRGATADLSDAMNCLNAPLVLKLCARLQNAIYYLRESKNAAPKNSLVTNTLLIICADSVKSAEATLQTAADLLRSTLRPV